MRYPEAISLGIRLSDTVVDLAHRTSQRNGLSLVDASVYNRRPDQFCFLFTWSMGSPCISLSSVALWPSMTAARVPRGKLISVPLVCASSRYTTHFPSACCRNEWVNCTIRSDHGEMIRVVEEDSRGYIWPKGEPVSCKVPACEMCQESKRKLPSAVALTLSLPHNSRSLAKGDAT